MNSLNKLINNLQTDDTIKRFKELEDIIDHNESLQQDFAKLLDLQKKMVQKEYYNSKNIDQAKEEYEVQQHKVENYIVVEEYLDLLDIINNDIKLIQSIFEDELKIDLTTTNN